MRKIWGSHTGVGEDFGLPPWLRVDGYMSSNVSDDLMPASSEQSTKKRSFLFGLPKKLIQFATPKHWYEYINTRGVISKKTGISILCFYNLNGDNNGWIVDGQDSLRTTKATLSWHAHYLLISHQQATHSSLLQPKWENLPKRTHTDTIRALAPQGISREPDGTEHHSRCPLQAIKLSPTPHTSTISTKTSSRTTLLFCFLLL